MPAAPLPAGSTDTHVHVFDPARHPYAATRSYTPGTATADDLRRLHAGLGLDRTVLVQPSVHGTDNRCLLDAIARLGTDRSRGIAVVDPQRTSRAERQALHDGGVRGIRLNLKVRAAADADTVRTQLVQAVEWVADQPGWCVQVHGPATLLPLVAQWLPHLPAAAEGASPLVLDHFAGLGADALRHPHTDALLGLLDSGRVYLKLSAPYRVSSAAPDHADLDPLAARLVRAQPARLLWGSDWPHTGGDGVRAADPQQIEPFRTIDLPAALGALRRWSGDAAVLRQILVDNPAALYGF